MQVAHIEFPVLRRLRKALWLRPASPSERRASRALQLSRRRRDVGAEVAPDARDRDRRTPLGA